MSAPRKYRVVALATPFASHIDAKAGDFVYECFGYDYGLASDDTRATGIPHRSVTLSRFGAYPSFTIPEEALEPVEPDVPEYPSDEHTKTVCKIGAGAETCRYLTMGAHGWSCEKHSSVANTLDRRVRNNEMVAQGDNCEGLYSR